MFWTLLRHEGRLLRRELGLLLFLLLLCLGLAGLNGHRQIQILSNSQQTLRHQEQQRLAKEVNKARKEEQRLLAEGFSLERYDKASRNPLKVAQKGTQALFPPGPLSSLVLGQTDLQVLSTQITLTHAGHLPRQEQLNHPQALFLGQFDLSFVIVWLLPLFILALSFDILASEQESGMLRMLLSQPITLNQLVWSKIGLRALVLALAIVFGLLTVTLAQGIELGSVELLLRWSGLVAVTLCYGAAWFALALWVNTRPRPAATQATLLALIWLVVLFVIPASLNLALSALYPLPSRVAFVQASSQASEKVRTASSQMLGKYFEDHPELSQGRRDEAEFNLLQLAKEDLIGQEIAPVATHFRSQLSRQQAVLNGLQFLSPALVTQAALSELAGSSGQRLQAYQQQVEIHQQRWRAWFTPRIKQNQAIQVKDYAHLPQFQWQEPAVAMPWSVLAYLLALTLLSGGLALRAFRDYRVVEDT